MRATAGTWDRTRRGVYFIGGARAWVKHAALAGHDHVLLAVNELGDDRTDLDEVLDVGAHVLIDSGIFWLTNEHKRKHGISMNEALALPPNKVDGWPWLLERYVRINSAYGDRVWGYIELDQGGRDQKRETRAMLHDRGLSPIPVYHPLNDGWEYFDELAQGYDRICFGNIVQAGRAERTRLLHMLWERHRDYPDLYVHILGLTPNTIVTAFPWDSADSSSWLGHVRWARGNTRALGAPAGAFPAELLPRPGAPDQQRVSVLVGASDEHFAMEGVRHWHEQCERLADRYPPRSRKGDTIRSTP